jgi:hypothetical protein
MRQAFISLVAILLFSCNSENTSKISSDHSTIKEQTDTVTRLHRQKLIEELKRLQGIFSSGDREKIADVFPFPLADTTVGIYIDDSTYFEQLKKNGDKTTRAMFLHFFPQIYSNLQIDELNQLFKHIDPAALIQKDTLGHEVHIKTEPCYKFYHVQVEQDFVTLSLGSDVNDYYKNPSSENDDMQENSSEYCESSLWWVFRFDGKKLHFIKLGAAG